MNLYSTTGGSSKLTMRGVSKAYPGVQALDDVSLNLDCGEILGLVGENGAGKSTLIKTLAGAIAPDSAQILIDGVHRSFDSPVAARRQGPNYVNDKTPEGVWPQGRAQQTFVYL